MRSAYPAQVAARSIRAAAGEGNGRTGESLEPSLMPRKAELRKMGRWSGVEGLAAVERQAPAGQFPQSGMSTAVLGVQRAPTPVAARVCGTR
jgi:hypothetical protein